jgi:hypothetical protein
MEEESKGDKAKEKAKHFKIGDDTSNSNQACD